MRLLKLSILLCVSLSTANVEVHAQSTGKISMAQVGKNSVNTHNGTYGTSVEIEVPEYFGIQPSLSLTYVSDRGMSQMGFGWDLDGISAIERVGAKKGQANLTVDDIYLLDGAELVPCAKQTVTPPSPSCANGGTHSTKVESFQKIKYIAGANGADIWQVWDKAGTRADYKSLRTVTSGINVYSTKYGISTVTDLYNRITSYDYVFDLNGGKSIHIDKIRYNNNKFEVQFYWLNAGRAFTSGNVGTMDSLKVRLKSVSVRVADLSGMRVARAYELMYSNDLVSSITLHGTDSVLGSNGVWSNAGAQPMVLAKYKYQETVPGWTETGIKFLNPSRLYRGNEEAFYKTNGINPSVGVDINGDGLTDFVGSARVTLKGVPQTGWFESKETSINKRLGANNHVLEHTASWALPANTSVYELDIPSAQTPPTFPKAITGATVKRYGQFADINGDGRPDFIYKTQKYLNTGLGWALTTKWITPGTYNGDQFLDINDDGLADLLRVTKNAAGATTNEVYLNSAEGFSRHAAWNFPNVAAYLHNDFAADKGKSEIDMVDQNKDGMVDLIVSTLRPLYTNIMDVQLYLNTGRGFVASGTPYSGMTTTANYWLSIDNVGASLYQVRCGETGFLTFKSFNMSPCSTQNSSAIGDFNGDGFSDIINDYSSKILMSNTVPFLLSEITGTLGGKTAITYKKSTEFDNTYKCNANGTANALGAMDCQGMPDAKWVVDKVSTDPMIGTGGTRRDPISVVSYDYLGGLFDGKERMFLGFRYVKETLPSIISEPVAAKRETWYKMAEGQITQPERVDFTGYSAKAGTAVLYSSRLSVFKTNGALIPRTSFPETEWQYNYDGSGTVCNFTASASPCAFAQRTRMDSQYDIYGNVIKNTDYGDFDRPGDEAETTTLYAPNTSTFMVDASYESTTKSLVDGSIMGKSVSYFDNSTALGAPPVKGEVTKSGQWLNTLNNGAGDYVYTYSTFNPSNGVVTSSTDTSGAVTKFFYDTLYGYLVTEQQDQMGNSGKSTWDYVCEANKETIDIHGLKTTTTYDKFCRPLRVDKPDGNYERWEYDMSTQPKVYQYGSPLAPGTQEIYTASLHDGLGRVIGETSFKHKVNSTEIFYDARGNILKNSIAGLANVWVAFEYDVMGRQTKIINPDNSFQSIEYTHTTITSTDEEGGKEIEISDANGRVVEQRELASDGSWLTKTFKYDTKANLSEVRDMSGNVWTMEYDTLGRKVRFVDPDAGVSLIYYNNGGNIDRTINNSGAITKFTYDILGRITEKKTNMGKADQKLFQWFYGDERTGFVNRGRLTRTAFPGGSKVINYNVYGNIVNETNTVEGRAYTKNFIYNNTGLPTSVTQPDGSIITYEYGQGGLLRTIPGYIDWILYDNSGNISTISATNRTKVQYTYSPSRNWLNSVTTTDTSGAAFQRYYFDNRDKTGRIKAITGSSGNWAYGYDKLGQLLTASGPNYSQAFEYDKTGNIKSLTKNGKRTDYTYGSAAFAKGETWSIQCPAYASATVPKMPHAVHTFGNEKYCYDLDGRMIRSNAGRSVSYDGSGQPTQVVNDASSIFGGGTGSGSGYGSPLSTSQTFIYDETGSRVAKTSRTETVHYPFGDDYEVDLRTGIHTMYISIGGDALSAGPIAKKVGNTKYWLHLDHQGSVRNLSDQSGMVMASNSYEAFGNKLTQTGTHKESRGFTGQRQDETGLFYLHARYYDPKLGRFISPDPAVPTPKMLGLNRYVYAENDPINKEDRNGYAYGGGYRGSLGSAGARVGGAIGGMMGGGMRAALGGISYASKFLSTLYQENGLVRGLGLSKAATRSQFVYQALGADFMQPRQVRQLNSTLKPLKRSLTVHRFVHPGELGSGSVYTRNKGYPLSTTLDPNWNGSIYAADGTATRKITLELPRGYRAAVIGDTLVGGGRNQFAFQKEVLAAEGRFYMGRDGIYRPSAMVRSMPEPRFNFPKAGLAGGLAGHMIGQGLALLEHKRAQYGYAPTPWAQAADYAVRAYRQFAFGSAGNFNLKDMKPHVSQQQSLEYRAANPIRLAEPVRHGPLKSDGTY